MRQALGTVGLLLAWIVGLSLSWPAAAGASPAVERPELPAVPAEVLVGQLVQGQPVEYTAVKVVGDMDLERLQTVTRPLRCRDCTFTGSFAAGDVVFERTVDLSGATVEGAFTVSGAKFADPFLLASSERATSRLLGPNDFSLTSFDDLASFDGTRFLGRTTFSSVRFGGPTSFDEAGFSEPALFGRARFEASASFSDADFAKSANFRGATFAGLATFRSSDFAAAVDYQRAVFTGPVDFDLAHVRDEITLQQAKLGTQTTFRVFKSEGQLSLEQVGAQGPIDFSGAFLLGQGANLSNLSSSGALSLQGVTAFQERLLLERIAVPALLMEVDRVDLVQGSVSQRRGLELIEEGAKARGDLAEANRARFRLLSLLGAEAGFVDHLYREIFGYLVLPTRPALALVVTMLLAASLRTACTVRGERVVAQDTRREGSARGIVGALRSPVLVTYATAWTGQLYRSATRAFRRHADTELRQPETLRSYAAASASWAEVAIYRLLIAVCVLSLGNSNATIRQFLDSVAL